MPQNNKTERKQYDLSSLSVFEGFSESQIKADLILLKARIKTFSKGEIIVLQGQKVDSIGIIVQGSATVEKTDWNGNRNILFEINKNTMFGESLLCTGADSFMLTITSREDTTVLFIDSGKLKDNRLNFSDKSLLMLNIMKIMARNNLAFRDKLDILSQRSTKEKLLQYLTIQSRIKNTNSFEIPLDRQALSDYLGVERTALSKVISKLEKDGVLVAWKNHFELKKF